MRYPHVAIDWRYVLQVLLPCKSAATATPNLTWQRMTRENQQGVNERPFGEMRALYVQKCLMWVTKVEIMTSGQSFE